MLQNRLNATFAWFIYFTIIFYGIFNPYSSSFSFSLTINDPDILLSNTAQETHKSLWTFNFDTEEKIEDESESEHELKNKNKNKNHQKFPISLFFHFYKNLFTASLFETPFISCFKKIECFLKNFLEHYLWSRPPPFFY